MGWKSVFSVLFILLAVLLLFLYWFVPFRDIQFASGVQNSNFSLVHGGEMQFYKNMRFPDSKISYYIDNCPLQKSNEMEEAFAILEQQTILEFFPVKNNEDITVSCEGRNRIEEGLFIAGEGGPTNITDIGEFSLITKGEILLIRGSECQEPNVAVHELLHVLGFNHSENKKNIMYYISDCKQVIGDDQINLLNKLYSYPNFPDLSIEKVDAYIHGRYLDTNITIKNKGFKTAPKSILEIYSDGKFAKEIEISQLEIGYGSTISLKNVWIPTLSVKELEFIVRSTFDELKKENNKIVLAIKNNN